MHAALTVSFHSWKCSHDSLPPSDYSNPPLLTSIKALTEWTQVDFFPDSKLCPLCLSSLLTVICWAVSPPAFESSVAHTSHPTAPNHSPSLGPSPSSAEPTQTGRNIPSLKTEGRSDSTVLTPRSRSLFRHADIFKSIISAKVNCHQASKHGLAIFYYTLQC